MNDGEGDGRKGKDNDVEYDGGGGTIIPSEVPGALAIDACAEEVAGGWFMWKMDVLVDPNKGAPALNELVVV